MYSSLEDFTSAVTRLGELRRQGLLTPQVTVAGKVHFQIDKGASDVPASGDGLYLDIFDALSSIARGTSIDAFTAARSADDAEPERDARAKYEAAAAAFPPATLRPGLRDRAVGAQRALLARLLLEIGRRSGRLSRLMSSFAFRRALGPDGRRAAWRALGAQIDDTAMIAPGVWIRIPRNVSVGAGTKVGGRTRIDSYQKVTIGRNTIMNDVDVFTAQHDVNDPGFKAEQLPVTVGDYVWMPRKIVLLPGVTIGNYAVIGTGSVVPRDIPDYAVAVGNPAQVVKERARIPYTYVPTSVHRAPMLG